MSDLENATREESKHHWSHLPNLTLRRLSLDEVPLMTPLLQERNPKISSAVLKQRAQEMFSQSYQCVGAFEDKKLVGISGYWIKTRYHTGKVIEPDNVYVLDSHKSKGIGKFLLLWIENHGRETGCNEIELHCYVANHKAHRFWLRHGFDIIAHHFSKSLL